MEIIYLRQALKDVHKVKDAKIKRTLLDVIHFLKQTENLSEIKNVKKITGHPEAYRIRIRDYRLGFYYAKNTITIARFVKRNDIYKLFP